MARDAVLLGGGTGRVALTEAVTRLADRPDPVPDSIWSDVAEHYDEQALAGLVLAIANINVWNRLNAATSPDGRHRLVRAAHTARRRMEQKFGSALG